MPQPTEEEHNLSPVRMDQAMSVAAVMIAALIGTFGRAEDTPEELTKLHQTCIAVFLHQLLMASKHKDTMAKILEAIIIELRNPPEDS